VAFDLIDTTLATGKRWGKSTDSTSLEGINHGNSC